MLHAERACFPTLVACVVVGCCIIAVTVVHMRGNSLRPARSDQAVNVSTRSGTILSDDGRVRDCVTGVTIGQVRGSRLRLAAVIDREQNTTSTEQSSDRSMAFKTIFDKKIWGSQEDTHSGLSVSGPGSALTFTHEVMATLHAIITALKDKYGLHRIRLLDMPCGDMGWMSRFLETRVDVDYTGVDIVKEVIDRHRTQFADRPWKFEHLDFVNSPIPFRRHHLILCRMALQHLTNAAVLRVLSRMSVPDAKEPGPAGETLAVATNLLTTTFGHEQRNTDTVTGGFRWLNLEIPPVALKQPLCLAMDGPRSYNHFLGMWSLPLLTVSNCSIRSNVLAAFGGRYKFYSCASWSM